MARREVVPEAGGGARRKQRAAQPSPDTIGDSL
jgi:hypothetical protein